MLRSSWSSIGPRGGVPELRVVSACPQPARHIGDAAHMLVPRRESPATHVSMPRRCRPATTAQQARHQGRTDVDWAGPQLNKACMDQELLLKIHIMKSMEQGKV